jgi:hypothetical protein
MDSLDCIVLKPHTLGITRILYFRGSSERVYHNTSTPNFSPMTGLEVATSILRQLGLSGVIYDQRKETDTEQRLGVISRRYHCIFVQKDMSWGHLN